MRVALINLEEDLGCLPIGLTYIAAYIRKYGGFNDVRIIEREDFLKSIKKYNPDIIGMSVVSEQYYKANELAFKIKKIINAPLIIGGAHITALPEQIKKGNFDIGVIGEGELTFLELLNLYKKEKKFEDKFLKKINGIIFLDKNKKLISTGRRDLIKNLDKIPFPALDLLKMKEQYLVPGPAGVGLIGIRGYIMTSRGCPYNCVYCGSNTAWGGRGTRWHSAERVVNDIKIWVKKYKANHFAVYDDIMTANKPRLRKIVSLLERENLPKKIDFALYGRANMMDDEICSLLKRMNVTSISFGLESGSERVLKYLKKGTVTVKQGRDAVNLCSRYGLKVTGLFMIGSPGETEEDFKKTYEFASEPVFSTVQIYQTTPLPGTELWNTGLKQGLIKENFYNSPEKGSPVKLNTESILTTKVSKESFLRWYKKFMELMARKNYSERELRLNLKMIKFFFSYRFLLKLLKRRRHIPLYLKQILRI